MDCVKRLVSISNAIISYSLLELSYSIQTFL